MQPGNYRDYDFSCGHDARFVNVAIRNDTIHTIMIESESAKSIDFSGGTRRVQKMLLHKCFKLTSITWPIFTGSIKQLEIGYADKLGKLDLSSLQSLEEISILNCPLLETITGLPATLKKINIHGAPIAHLDLSSCKELAVINIDTTHQALELRAEKLLKLNAVSLITAGVAPTQSDNPVNIQLKHCHTLYLLNINTGLTPAIIKLADCPNLITASLSAGEHSTLTGLSECVKLDFLHLNSLDHFEMNEASKRIATHVMAAQNNHSPEQAKQEKLGDIQGIFTEFHSTILYPEPGPEDEETVIQKNYSNKEEHRASKFTITLLSAPIEFHKLDDASEFWRDRRLAVDAPLPFEHELFGILYLSDLINHKDITSYLSKPLSLAESASPESVITQWLSQGQQGNQTSVLRLTNQDMNQPIVNTLLPRLIYRQPVVIANKTYPLTPRHIALLDDGIRPKIHHLRNNLLASDQAGQVFLNQINHIQGLAAQMNLASVNSRPVNPMSHAKQLLNQINQVTQLTPSSGSESGEWLAEGDELQTENWLGQAQESMDDPWLAQTDNLDQTKHTHPAHSQPDLDTKDIARHIGEITSPADEDNLLHSAHAKSSAFSTQTPDKINKEGNRPTLKSRKGVDVEQTNLTGRTTPVGESAGTEDPILNQARALSEAEAKLNDLPSIKPSSAIHIDTKGKDTFFSKPSRVVVEHQSPSSIKKVIVQENQPPDKILSSAKASASAEASDQTLSGTKQTVRPVEIDSTSAGQHIVKKALPKPARATQEQIRSAPKHTASISVEAAEPPVLHSEHVDAEHSASAPSRHTAYKKPPRLARTHLALLETAEQLADDLAKMTQELEKGMKKANAPQATIAPIENAKESLAQLLKTMSVSSDIEKTPDPANIICNLNDSVKRLADACSRLNLAATAKSEADERSQLRSYLQSNKFFTARQDSKAANLQRLLLKTLESNKDNHALMPFEKELLSKMIKMLDKDEAYTDVAHKLNEFLAGK